MAKPRKPSSPRKRAGKTKLRDEVVSTVKRSLPVPINAKLSLEKEHRITEALTEKKEEQEKMNAEILPRRKRIKELEGEIETLRAQVMKGTEDRDVVCDVIKDYKRMTVKVVRRDTDKVVEERTMTAEDRQEDLLKAGGGRGKKAEPADDDDADDDEPGDDDRAVDDDHVGDEPDPGETEEDAGEDEVH